MWPRKPKRRPPLDTHAIEEATNALEIAMSRWPEVNDTVSKMRRLRQRNHFADSLRHALKGDG